jgi:hypothetical protein
MSPSYGSRRQGFSCASTVSYRVVSLVVGGKKRLRMRSIVDTV